MSKFNYYELVVVRGGMLATQLYELLDVETRPCYATFLKDVRSTPKLFVAPAVGRTNSLYVTTDKRIISNPIKFNTDRMRLLIMVHAFEAALGKPADWFVSESYLVDTYAAIQGVFPGLAHMDDTCDWLNDYACQRRLIGSKGKLKKTSKKPGFSLLNLHRQNIYLQVSPDFPVKLRFTYFDINNNLNRKDFRFSMVAIFEFIAYHKLALDFEVVALCWSDERADLLENVYTFPVSELSISAKVEKYPGTKIAIDNAILYNYKPEYYRYLKSTRFVSLGLNPAISYHASKTI